MSLVDYASSSDDDVSEAEEQHHQQKDEQPRLVSKHQPSPPLPPPNNQRSESSSSTNQPKPLESAEKLPDASILLNSSSISLVAGSDHASRVAAAMAESATRKRDSKGVASSSTLPRSKIPKGTLPHSKNALDTAGGLLVPPQLKGRSNVVTEDISRLFVRKQAQAEAQADPSSQ